MPRRFSVDSSCMVAAVCAWHERHEDAANGLERRLGRGEQLVVPAHALVETYAVLTRLPAPHRLAPADAWALVEANFVANAKVATVDARTHVGLLGELASLSIGGGRTYDALIAACAHGAGAGSLLTFNRRHFDPAPAGLEIVEPDEED